MNVNPKEFNDLNNKKKKRNKSKIPLSYDKIRLFKNLFQRKNLK